MLHASHREAQAAQERAEAAIALSTEQEFALWLTRGVVLRGWALAEQGQGEEGIIQMREGLADYRATGAEVARPYWLALLAEAYGKVGQTEQGLIGLTEAVAVAHNTGERFYEAELYRLRGELLLQAGKRQKLLEAAATCFDNERVIHIESRYSGPSHRGQAYGVAAMLTPAEVLSPALLTRVEQANLLACYWVWYFYLRARELVAGMTRYA